MKTISTLILLLCLFGCQKTSNTEQPSLKTGVLFPYQWLEKKKADYSSCVCLTNFLRGSYKNETVIEIRGVDPLCNGINKVYRTDGSLLLSSADQPAYQNYLVELKEATIIWSCR